MFVWEGGVEGDTAYSWLGLTENLTNTSWYPNDWNRLIASDYQNEITLAAYQF